MRIYRALSLFFLLVALPSILFAQGYDHSKLDSFLKRHVDAQGLINYSQAANDREDLNEYLEQIKSADIKAIDSSPQPERLAFWVNVYHAALLELIFQKYPIRSTQDVPSFWERRFLDIGVIAPHPDEIETISSRQKYKYSLAQIREKKLTAGGEEKIHLVLATASVSGPLFPQEAFEGRRMVGQLFKRTRSEVARPETMTVDLSSKTVTLSQIFEWYAPDFMATFSRPERRAKLSRPDTAVINFLSRYSRDVEEMKFLKSGDFKINYFPYDWSLNDRKTE